MPPIFQPLLMNCEIVVRLIWYFLTLVSVVDYEVATDLILRDSRAIETDKAVKKQMGKQNYEREKVLVIFILVTKNLIDGPPVRRFVMLLVTLL